MMVALILSFFHLNNPINAVNALNNLKTSWLSREILFVSLFLFCLVLLNGILYFKNPGIQSYRTYILVTTLMGIILVYTMSRLYMIPTVPAWSGVSTLIEFYSTALLIGSAFVLGIDLYQGTKSRGEQGPGNKTRILASISLVAVALIFVNGLFFSQNVAEGNIAFKPDPLHPSLGLIRWITIGLGTASIIYILYKKDRTTRQSLAFYLPFAFFLISELVARAAFYASFYNIGL
jgi:anaerobic dimethyl sulfoxide reductase subunit C (anchor subunit)